MTCVIVFQVYLLLDEFIMGGELQETSKKVRSGHTGKHRWLLPSPGLSPCTDACCNAHAGGSRKAG